MIRLLAYFLRPRPPFSTTSLFIEKKLARNKKSMTRKTHAQIGGGVILSFISYNTNSYLPPLSEPIFLMMIFLIYHFFDIHDSLDAILRERLMFDCLTSYVMRCAIWHHLYNLKNVKNTHEGVLILVKLQA